MIKCDYTGLEEQKEKHSQFIDKLCDFQKDFLKNKKVIKINLFNFVWDWFSIHILGTDRKIGIFLKEQS